MHGHNDPDEISEAEALDDSGFRVSMVSDFDREPWVPRKTALTEVNRLKRKAGETINPDKKPVRGAKVEVKCKCCKQTFLARVADRKRGWGKYCSKSCKANRQVLSRGLRYGF